MGQGLFIPVVHDFIIIIGSRSITYTFGSCFDYKHWVKVFYQNLNFNFLGQVFQYFCWVLKRVDWGSHHIPILFVGSQSVSIEVRITRYSSTPIRRHWNGIKHILCYLRGRTNFGIVLSKWIKSTISWICWYRLSF